MVGNHNMLMTDLTWTSKACPKNLIAFNEIKGQWTYPKKGFIQWKKKNE